MANPLKTALAAGRVQIGLWLGLGNPVTAEIAAGAGYDWCLIDAEHAPNDLGAILAQLVAIEAQGVAAAVRVPANDPVWLKRVLDLGVGTVVVPMVDSAAAAAAAVAACRYPPAGSRGMAPGLVRASGYGARADYAAGADAGICVIVQAESAAAVAESAAIAAVPGVDGVFVGPLDLAASLGHPGRPDAPEVAAATARVFAATRAAGKAAGSIAFDAAGTAGLAAAGVTFLAVGSDVALAAQAFRDRARAARQAIG